MRLTKFAIGLFVFWAVVGAFAQETTLSGTWTVKTSSQQGTSEQTATIQQTGNKFTGEMTTAQGAKEEIKDGAVNGDDIQFVIERKRPTGETAKVSYKGKLNGSGDEIEGSFTGASGREVKFTATRQK